MNTVKRLVPFILFLSLIGFLYKGLQHDPHKIPSALINKSVPAFKLTEVKNNQQYFTQKDLLGHISLINVWATWCIACQIDHPEIVDIAKNNPEIKVYGIDYKDDKHKAQQWLSRFGNPFIKTGFDEKGDVAINWGVYGTPETFLVDQKGVIRYKRIGVMSDDIWQQQFVPRIKRLQHHA